MSWHSHLCTVTDPVEQLLINAFLNLWSLILACLGGLYCERIGRRPLFLMSTAGMLLFFTLQTICSSQYALHQNKNAGNAVIAFICEFRSFWDYRLLKIFRQSCSAPRTPSRTHRSSRRTQSRFYRSLCVPRATPSSRSRSLRRWCLINILTQLPSTTSLGNITSVLLLIMFRSVYIF